MTRWRRSTVFAALVLLGALLGTVAFGVPAVSAQTAYGSTAQQVVAPVPREPAAEHAACVAGERHVPRSGHDEHGTDEQHRNQPRHDAAVQRSHRHGRHRHLQEDTGTFAKRASYNLGTGWNQIVASCDSVLLINTSTDTQAWGLLQRGTYTAHGSSSFFHVTLAAASCDSVVAYNPANDSRGRGQSLGRQPQWRRGVHRAGGLHEHRGHRHSALSMGSRRAPASGGSLTHGVYSLRNPSSFSKGITSIAGTAEHPALLPRGRCGGHDEHAGERRRMSTWVA